MKRLVLFSVSFIFSISLFGQVDEIENWRSKGFQAKTEKDYDTAIEFYQKILESDAEDYDAKLALARLYILSENYHQSILIFNEIFSSDSTDVEAMNGLGECYSLTGNDKKSILYYEMALSFLPGDVQQYFFLAKAYGNGGMLDQAIEVYREINRVDSTYSEAWAGIAKMYFWKGKPETSVGFYKKALALDPENEEIMEELQTVERELDYGLSVNFGPVNEKEESYEITALISKIGFEKRIGDQFQVQASYLLDYSNRDYASNTYDTTRWYTNVWVKGSWISEHHTVSAFGGYSNTDDKISAYGVNWKMNYTAGPVTVKNSLNASYDYFYYWNKVGKKSVSDEMQLSYRFLGFNAGYTYGMIDPVAVYNAEGESETLSNPYQAYSLSLIFKVLKRPDIRIGLNHSYLDYEYKSSLYYSPFGRTLTGASASVYYSFAKLYAFGSFSYNIGKEYTDGQKKEEKIDVDNWSSNIELGYNHQQFSFSVGASNFYNPYYQNLTGYMAIKILF